MEQYKEQSVDARTKPLTGVRVLDMTHAYSGPFCTMHLADQGAEVIKLEVPGKGDQSRGWAPFKNGASGYYAYINRNKFGLTLNLKTEEGKAIFKKLIKEVDVLCENFRVGTLEKLGLGYEVLKDINPSLIYASISGFGLEGPEAELPSYDLIAQAMGGLMSMTGEKDHMYKVGSSIADNYSGTYLSLAIVMALFQRERTGMGRRVDVSMLDTIFSILETGALSYELNGDIVEAVGNRNLSVAPCDILEAADGQFALVCGTQRFWRSLCQIMGKPELADDPRFADNKRRCEHYPDELKPIIEGWSRQHTLDELEKQLSDAEIPFGRIADTKGVCENPVIKRRHMLWDIDDPAIGETISVPGTPIKIHGCEDKAFRPAPTLGQHTDDILKNIVHLTAEEIARLHEEGVI
ncbi:MAG: CoA transferase [Megasphaera massiliensis]|uniref:CaiB/BaiF CoA transferase family protein n=1 Tax=Megasphaera TaxID=906 RepID=UPI001CD46796|nr:MULTISPECIES: CoA transferase [Megasphaera]MCB5736492.1 CoA transferase [Megasphaera massiliensis]UBS53385.1 CoA transferase [Megasphaera massiliensis]